MCQDPDPKIRLGSESYFVLVFERKVAARRTLGTVNIVPRLTEGDVR